MKPLLICMALLCCQTAAAETLFSCQAGKDRYELNRNGSRLVLSHNGQKLSDTAAASAIQSHTPATISLLVQNKDRADNVSNHGLQIALCCAAHRDYAYLFGRPTR